MKDFIIDETYEQVCINSEGNIEISGLLNRDAIKIDRDAESAGMRSRIVNKIVKDCVLIDVGFNAVILKGRELSILLNPDEYPVEDIIIKIK